jgi:hypothetical protein
MFNFTKLLAQIANEFDAKAAILFDQYNYAELKTRSYEKPDTICYMLVRSASSTGEKVACWSKFHQHFKI